MNTPSSFNSNLAAVSWFDGLRAAFDERFHERSDLEASADALQIADAPRTPRLDALARAWLDSAALLRQAEPPRTFATCAAVVASTSGPVADEVRAMIGWLLVAPANDG